MHKRMPPKKPATKRAPKRAPAKKATKKEEAASAEAPKAVERAPKPTVPAETATREKTQERYWEAVGRRKTAVARVRLFTRGEKSMAVNVKPLAEYFHYPRLQSIASEAVDIMKSSDRFRVSAKVSGGGLHAQAEAIRHGTARALVLFNPDFRKRLKRAGFLTRDPRMKERKKFGLKGARRAPQWAKR